MYVNNIDLHCHIPHGDKIFVFSLVFALVTSIISNFTGNIILKFAESVLDLLKARLMQYAETGFTRKIWVGMMSKTLKKILKTFDYQEHGGAPLLGLNGVSVIGHGASTPYAIKKMIFRAEEMIRNDINGKIAEALKNLK